MDKLLCEPNIISKQQQYRWPWLFQMDYQLLLQPDSLRRSNNDEQQSYISQITSLGCSTIIITDTLKPIKFVLKKVKSYQEWSYQQKYLFKQKERLVAKDVQLVEGNSLNNKTDQKLFEVVLNVISNSVSFNQNILIGFVISQQVKIGTFFMLESILSKFSNNLIKNIVFLFPDCTDEDPKQKVILQSKAEIINGIQSPVFQMIPKMNNFWYLKFNTTALFIENKTQENRISWEIGKNSFQLLLQDYLSHKFDYNKLQDMRNKYNEFINKNFSEIKGQLNNKFLYLYRRDNFDKQNEQTKEQINNKWSEISSYLTEINSYQNNSQYYYNIKDKSKEWLIRSNLDSIIKYGDQSYKSTITQIEEFQTLTKDQKVYNKEFEEFYDMFKNLVNLIQQDYNPWRLYFKFHAILISINRYQWKYYEHLISKEQLQKQDGWENRVKLLKKTRKFFFYSDGQSDMLNLDQRIKEWSDKYLNQKSRIVQFFLIQRYEYPDKGSELYFDDKRKFESFKFAHDRFSIQYRINSDCQKNFDEFINKIWEIVLN
ncbi:unnamed protein product [Paramecium primaurelia]|uniref:Uncharacterized protein n=1 Tax=Paramecium primaurelia TaxID=5886 RepID=A0A8S1QLZ0_PARPR|nr:unnamed protein product [Paramecium primaurelia]